MKRRTPRRHIATYPLLEKDVKGDFKKRVGTGVIRSAEQIGRIARQLEQTGHPFTIRWASERARVETYKTLGLPVPPRGLGEGLKR